MHFFVPQIPEFSTTRRLPGVVAAETTVWGCMSGKTFGTPPITPSMTGICEANTYVSGNSVSTDSNDEIMAGALRQEKRQAKPLAKAHFMSSINLFLIAVLVFHNPERLMGQRAHCFFDAIAFLDTSVATYGTYHFVLVRTSEPGGPDRTIRYL